MTCDVNRSAPGNEEEHPCISSLRIRRRRVSCCFDSFGYAWSGNDRHNRERPARAILKRVSNREFLHIRDVLQREHRVVERPRPVCAPNG
jgi:hypothetical protein